MKNKEDAKTTESLKEGPVTKVNVGRLTNCIFAFSLLYLFKNIQIPTIFDIDTVDYLNQYLGILIPEVYNFINAFLIIAIIWVLTFQIIHFMRKVNHAFLYIHFALLMTLVFIPVSSMLADDFPTEPLFSLILHLNVFLICFLLLIEWLYVSRKGELIHNTLTGQEKQGIVRQIFILTSAAIIGSFFTLFHYEGTRFVYLLVLLLLLVDSTIISRTKHSKQQRKEKSCEITAENRKDKLHAPVSVLQAVNGVKRTPVNQGPVELGMLEILMNGVFAFTMTLIVKNIPLPRTSDVQNIELMVKFLCGL